MVRYQLGKNEEAIILELQTSHIFEIIDLNNLVEIKDDVITDVSGITPTLVGIAIGTIRGLIISKTAGTPLADYPLPIINPQLLCKNLLRKEG